MTPRIADEIMCVVGDVTLIDMSVRVRIAIDRRDRTSGDTQREAADALKGQR